MQTASLDDTAKTKLVMDGFWLYRLEGTSNNMENGEGFFIIV